MKNLVLYMLAMLGTLYILFMYRQPSLYYLLVFEALFLFLMAAYSFLLRRSVMIELSSAESTARKNTEIPLDICVKNYSWLPVPHFELKLVWQNSFLSKEETMKIQGSVSARKHIRMRAGISSRYCGTIRIACTSFATWDLLKLFPYRTKPEGCETELSVLPSIHETEVKPGQATAQFFSDSDTYSKTKSGDDPSEVFKIREYQEGDKLQNIHWKLTAKKGTMMVRENSLPLGFHVLILLDIREAPPAEQTAAVMDTCLETILSLSQSMLEHECYHHVAWYDGASGQARRQAVDSSAALYELADQLMKISQPEPLEDLYALYQQTWLYSRQNTILRINEQLELTMNGRLITRLDPEQLEAGLGGLQLTV